MCNLEIKEKKIPVNNQMIKIALSLKIELLTNNFIVKLLKSFLMFRECFHTAL